MRYKQEEADLLAQTLGTQIMVNILRGCEPKIGLILGSGWDGALKLMENTSSVKFAELDHFCSVGAVGGQSNEYVFGELGGREVLAQKGRFHMYQDDDLVRLQVTTMVNLGITQFIITSGVGYLPFSQLSVGDVVIVESFRRPAGLKLPLYVNEFSSAKNAFSSELKRLAVDILLGEFDQAGRRVNHAFYLGPDIESDDVDKYRFARDGAHIVGMSMLPEAAIIANQPGCTALGLALITNGFAEPHDHQAVLAAGTENESMLAAYLETIVRDM